MNIFIEGNIGAGKSTLTQILENRFKDDCIAVLEPVDEWNDLKNNDGSTLLELFYGDLKKYSYLFQSVAFRTRIKKFNDHVEKGNYKFGFFERSIYADRHCFAVNCYESKLMNDIEWTDYKAWFDWLEESFKLPEKITGFIYLKTDPKVVYKRIASRNRSEESQISLDYLITLDNKHDKMINQMGIKHNVLVLDGDLDFKNDLNIQNDLVNKIKEFIKTCESQY